MYNQQLDTFLCVAETGSFLGAASRLYISASAVHQQINHLESHLKVKLMTRSPQGIQLTEAGKILYHEGKELVRANDLLLHHLREADSKGSNTIHVGTNLLTKCRLLIDLWNGFSSVNPDYRLLIEDSGTFFENLRGIDLIEGISWTPVVSRDYDHFVLVQVPIACAVPPGHHLYDKKCLKWTDLYGEVLITIMPGNWPELDSLKAEAESKHVIVQCVKTYNNAVFTSCLLNHQLLQIPLCWTDIMPAEMKIIPCDWGYSLPYGFHYSKNPDSPVHALIQYLRDTPTSVSLPWSNYLL